MVISIIFSLPCAVPGIAEDVCVTLASSHPGLERRTAFGDVIIRRNYHPSVRLSFELTRALVRDMIDRLSAFGGGERHAVLRSVSSQYPQNTQKRGIL